MNLLKTTIASLVLLTAIAFSYSHTKIENAEFGVCANAENSLVNLKLLNDGTFCYKDQSKSTNGTWQQTGNKVILEPCNEIKDFRNVWKLEKDNLAIKSRLGMSFYRLVNLEKCKDCSNKD